MIHLSPHYLIVFIKHHGDLSEENTNMYSQRGQLSLNVVREQKMVHKKRNTAGNSGRTFSTRGREGAFFFSIWFLIYKLMFHLLQWSCLAQFFLSSHVHHLLFYRDVYFLNFVIIYLVIFIICSITVFFSWVAFICYCFVFLSPLFL